MMPDIRGGSGGGTTPFIRPTKKDDSNDSSSSSSSPSFHGGPRITNPTETEATDQSETTVEEEFSAEPTNTAQSNSSDSANEYRSGAGYRSGNQQKVVSDTEDQKEKNRDKKSDGVLAGINHALNNPGETVDDTWRNAQKTWHDVDEGTKNVVDGTLDNDVFSVQDTIRGGAEAALGYDSKEQFAADSTKLAGTIKQFTQGKVAEGTALDNPVTEGVVDVSTFLGESFIADPSKAVITGLTGVDVDKGTAEGEVGAAEVADIALSVTGGKAGKVGLRGLKTLSKTDEAGKALAKLGLKGSDEGMSVIGKGQDAVSLSDETVETTAKATTKTTAKAGDETAGTSSRLADEIERYRKSVTGGDEAAETVVKGSDEAAETTAKASDETVEAAAKGSDEGESVLSRLTKTRKRKIATGATAAGATGILAGTAYDATVGFGSPSASPNTQSIGGDGPNSDGTNSDGSNNSNDSGTTWGAYQRAEVFDSGWVLGYQQVVTGSRRRWFLTAILEKGGPVYALTKGGTATKAPTNDAGNLLLNEMANFETETAARNAHKKWLKNREYNGDGTNNSPENTPDDGGDMQWQKWHQVEQVAPWFIWGRSHQDGEQVQFLAAGKRDGTTVYLSASGTITESAHLFDSYDSLKSALDAYFANVQNGTIPEGERPTGSGPKREEIERTVRESSQSAQSTTKSVTESLTGKNVAIAAVGVAGLAVLAGAGGSDGATAASGGGA